MRKLAERIRNWRAPYEGLAFQDHVENVRLRFGRPVVTVGDYIRSCTDRQLAEYHWLNYDCHLYDSHENCPDNDSKELCVKCWLKFLKSPIRKVGTNAE